MKKHDENLFQIGEVTKILGVTRKTLLVYDIAREFIQDKKSVLAIHCGKLNQGHNLLNEKYNWKNFCR